MTTQGVWHEQDLWCEDCLPCGVSAFNGQGMCMFLHPVLAGLMHREVPPKVLQMLLLVMQTVMLDTLSPASTDLIMSLTHKSNCLISTGMGRC